MANDIDLGKISITPEETGTIRQKLNIMIFGVIKMPNIWLYKIQPV